MITMVNLIATFDSYGDRRYYFEVDGEIVSECNVVQDNYIQGCFEMHIKNVVNQLCV